MRIVREVASQGLSLMKDASAERKQRLQLFHDFYSYLEKEYQPIIDRWDASHPREET